MDKEKQNKPENEEEIIKPDPETLHTTDPQEHMEGPVSSLVKKAEDIVEKEGSKADNEDKDFNKEENGE